MTVRGRRPFNLLSTSLPACFTVSSFIRYANYDSENSTWTVKYCKDLDIIIKCKTSTRSGSHQLKGLQMNSLRDRKLKSNLSRPPRIKIKCREHLFWAWERKSNVTVEDDTWLHLEWPVHLTAFYRLQYCITHFQHQLLLLIEFNFLLWVAWFLAPKHFQN